MSGVHCDGLARAAGWQVPGGKEEAGALKAARPRTSQACPTTHPSDRLSSISLSRIFSSWSTNFAGAPLGTERAPAGRISTFAEHLAARGEVAGQ